jgi:hypothetical protein
VFEVDEGTAAGRDMVVEDGLAAEEERELSTEGLQTHNQPTQLDQQQFRPKAVAR